MSIFDLLQSNAAALEAAGCEATYYSRLIAEALGRYQTARAHLSVLRTPDYGARERAITGARTRIQNRWSSVLQAVSMYDWAVRRGRAGAPSVEASAVLDVAPVVIAVVLLQAPRPDEVAPDYDASYAPLSAPGYPTVYDPAILQAVQARVGMPDPAALLASIRAAEATITLQDCIDAIAAQLHDLPDRVSEWPDPAGLLADVKPARGDFLTERDGRPVIVNDAGTVLFDGAEKPF